MNTELPSTHFLRAGQAAHLQLARGDAVVVTRGAVRLRTAPQWMAEGMRSTSLRLHEGERQLIETSGWVLIEAASGDAGVHVAPRQAELGRQAAQRRGWALAWWRRLAF